jgi:hypothetical protein
MSSIRRSVFVSSSWALPQDYNKSILHFNSQSVPRSKHIPTGQLKLYREIIAVCSQIHIKHINTLCGRNVELLNVKLAVYKEPVRTAQ